MTELHEQQQVVDEALVCKGQCSELGGLFHTMPLTTVCGTIVAADSITSRLPYRGLCDEPQARVR